MIDLEAKCYSSGILGTCFTCWRRLQKQVADFAVLPNMLIRRLQQCARCSRCLVPSRRSSGQWSESGHEWASRRLGIAGPNRRTETKVEPKSTHRNNRDG